MNARIDITAPLEIEISEAEILADLFYPAPPPSQARDAHTGVDRRLGRHAGRANGRAIMERGRDLRRRRAAV
jgi:hypothetical protein